METKICKICKLEKSLTEFSKNKRIKDGYKYTCKTCTHKRILTDEQKEKDRIRKRVEYKNNPTKRNEYKRNWQRNKKHTDKYYYLKYKISEKIRKCLKSNGYIKQTKTNEILGCSYNEFKQYIESKFALWMNWDNYGKYNGEFNYGWDIDHIIPLCSAKNEKDLITLNHYTNLQPLCSKMNRDIKRNNIF